MALSSLQPVSWSVANGTLERSKALPPKRLIAIVLSALLLVALVPASASPKSDKRQSKSASLARLMKLNADALFGDKANVRKARVKVEYAGGFLKGFDVASKTNQVFPTWASAQGATVLDEISGKELDEKSFAFAGRGRGGMADSRFPLADDFRIRFRLHASELTPRSAFSLILNRSGKGTKKESITVHLLNQIVVKRRKGKIGRRASGAFQGPIVKWFDATAERGMPFSIRFRDERLTVSTLVRKPKKNNPSEFESVSEEIVALDGIDAPRHGSFGFAFSGMTFVVRDLVVEGKVPGAGVA